MASVPLRPLDDAFVQRLHTFVDHTFQTQGTIAHWEAVLHHFEGRTNYEISAYIAENFRQNRWTGNETWAAEAQRLGLFNGYDRTRFDASNRPALDNGARDRYNPSNTFGRGNLFPTVPVTATGQAELNDAQFTALTPAQRQQYQLTSVFGGNRFQLVPGTNTSAAGPSGATAGQTQQNQPSTPQPNIPQANTTSAAGPSVAVTPQTGQTQQPQPSTPQPNTPQSITPQANTTSAAGPSGATTGQNRQNQPNTPQPNIPQANTISAAGPSVAVTPQTRQTQQPQPSTPQPNTPQSQTPQANTTSAAGPSGATTGQTQQTPQPVFDTTIGDDHDATNDGLGTPGGPSTPANPVNPFQGWPITPLSAPPGNNNTLQPVQGGGFQPLTPSSNPPRRNPVTPGMGVPFSTPGPVSTVAGGLPMTPATTNTGGGSQLATPAGANTAGATNTAGVGQTATPAGANATAGGQSATTGSTAAPGTTQPGATGGGSNVPNPAVLPAGEPADAHDFHGQRQPPVYTRLTQIITYLDEMDIDRDQYWEIRVREIEEYINERLSDPATTEVSHHLIQDALSKIRAHRLFNQAKYGPHMPNRSITADMIPATQPRLKYDGKLPLILGRDRNDKNNLLPHEYPTQPRTESVVNDMWLTAAEAQAGLDDAKRADRQAALARDEDAWWQLAPNQVPGPDNVSYRQSQTFEACIAVDGVGFSGWVDSRPGQDGVSIVRTLWNGDVLADCSGSYARERAVRRAGLQAALRQFSNTENQVANTPWRRVRLPLSAEEIDTMHRNAGGGPSRKFDLPKVRPNQVQRTDGKDDPQGFTANMAQFWTNQNRDMVRARDTVLSRMGFGMPVTPVPGQPAQVVPTVMPPMSLWGAYVDSGLSAGDQYHREMLSQMRTTKKLFDRELMIAPRKLLQDMNTLYNRGFDGDTDSFMDPVTGDQVRCQPMAQRDQGMLNGVTVPRDLDKMEIYWIRFLLTQSITPQMTEQLQPRATLFILFADKLARIFNDVSDPLFPSSETRVSVEDLLDHIHKKTDGPVRRIKFYVHDVQMWLERLHSQGRCRYQEDWRCYGWVRRPVPTCHPEQLIRWTLPADNQLRPDVIVEDLVVAPRFRHLRNWHSLVRRGLQNAPLHPEVENYFRCLAYRWGTYMRRLTVGNDGGGGLEQQWRTTAARTRAEMAQAIGECKTEYDRISQWNDAANNPLVRLVKTTMPARANDANLTADASLQIIRDNIINEAVKKDSTLWPARNANDYRNPADEKVRPPVWGWARPEVRGKVKRFFSVNRWPLQLQTQARQRMMTDDEDINVDFIWKPELEDPTPARYYRPKARPYVDEKVRFKPGHRNFAIGDTPHQKQVVIDRMFAQMSRAMAGDTDAAQGTSFGERWSRWTSYLRSRFDGSHVDVDDHDHVRFEEPGSRLRKFNARDIPKSYDPRKRRADQDAGHAANRPARLRRNLMAADVAGARQQGGGAADGAGWI
ncbi:hypothetical protein diail_5587 [Diaporthe ilicicola]|nr:hypothetical protein diail_5587 [Diaporthe ilicicola]